MLADVQRYWDDHVLNWQISAALPGSPRFFEEIERYRFSKLAYLSKRVPFERARGKRVLDVGCGLAIDAVRFAEAGAEVYGIDLSDVAVRYAQRNFAQRNLSGTFQQMDGGRLAFADETFDFVYCHTVLHFTPDPARMVGEIWRVLKPGGDALLMTVNRRSWMNVLRRVTHVPIDHLDAPVFNHMTRPEFRSLITEYFPDTAFVDERFPVPTEVHHGMKAILYNALFVHSFNLLPQRLVAPLGHHLLASCTKV